MDGMDKRGDRRSHGWLAPMCVLIFALLSFGTNQWRLNEIAETGYWNTGYDTAFFNQMLYNCATGHRFEQTVLRTLPVTVKKASSDTSSVLIAHWYYFAAILGPISQMFPYVHSALSANLLFISLLSMAIALALIRTVPSGEVRPKHELLRAAATLSAIVLSLRYAPLLPSLLLATILLLPWLHAAYDRYRPDHFVGLLLIIWILFFSPYTFYFIGMFGWAVDFACIPLIIAAILAAHFNNKTLTFLPCLLLLSIKEEVVIWTGIFAAYLAIRHQDKATRRLGFLMFLLSTGYFLVMLQIVQPGVIAKNTSGELLSGNVIEGSLRFSGIPLFSTPSIGRVLHVSKWIVAAMFPILVAAVFYRRRIWKRDHLLLLLTAAPSFGIIFLRTSGPHNAIILFAVSSAIALLCVIDHLRQPHGESRPPARGPLLVVAGLFILSISFPIVTGVLYLSPNRGDAYISTKRNVDDLNRVLAMVPDTAKLMHRIHPSLDAYLSRRRYLYRTDQEDIVPDYLLLDAKHRAAIESPPVPVEISNYDMVQAAGDYELWKLKSIRAAR